MYEINPVLASSQTSVATNIVSTSSTNVFTADQHIAALEQEIFALRNAKRTFDGVEILKPTHANKPVPAEQPKVPESTTKPMPPPTQPALAEKPAATTQPPLHPFTNVKEMSYQPPHECNFATAPAEPAKDKEPASLCSPYSKPVHHHRGTQQVNASTARHSITREALHYIPRSL
jgi:hypothetical protein